MYKTYKFCLQSSAIWITPALNAVNSRVEKLGIRFKTENFIIAGISIFKKAELMKAGLSYTQAWG